MKTRCIIAVACMGIFGCIFETPTDEALHPGISFSEKKKISRMLLPVTIYTEDSAALGKKKGSPRKVVTSFDYSIDQIATIAPITAGDEIVQANDIIISGNTAVIAYNFAGETFAGAIQVVDISQADKPAIVSEIIFEHQDINALCFKGKNVLYGGAADPAFYNYRSFFSMFALHSISLDDMHAAATGLPSYAVTGIAMHGTDCMIGYGARNGGISMLDNNNNSIDSLALADTRDVAVYQNGGCAVFGTTDNDKTTGGIALFTKDLTLSQPISIPDFGSDYHKCTIDIINSTFAVCALSEAGWCIVSLDEGKIITTQQNPIPATSDIKANCNSVSADANLLFTAHGNFGFQVYRISMSNLSKPERVGFIPFDSIKVDSTYASANHIAYKGNHLFVASGVGGVRIYLVLPRQ